MGSPAVAQIASLSMQEVATQLSPREFIKLCGIVDAIYGKTIVEVSSNATGIGYKKAERQLSVKFDVLDIVRAKELQVLVRTDRGEGTAQITVK